MPAAFRFDTRAWLLETEIEEGWEEPVKEQWRRNKELLRAQLIHEYGNEEHERKIADFTEMGRAPWSIIAPHNDVITDIRRAFAFGSYYSALLGTVGLGERILNDLVLTLRESYRDDPASQKVKGKQSFNDWTVMIEALVGWSVLDEEHGKKVQRLSRLRHDSVHYRSDRALDAREKCLNSMSLLHDFVGHVFAPLGPPPRFIAGTVGHSFIAIAQEAEPLVQHYFIPSCALVSPDFEFRNNCEELWDERGYGETEGLTDLSDDEFAERYNGRSAAAGETGATATL